MGIWSRACAYVKAHADHFLISIGVSLTITVIVNVIMHFLPSILSWLHVPARIVHLVTK